jgi:hypothetical protein
VRGRIGAHLFRTAADRKETMTAYLTTRIIASAFLMSAWVTECNAQGRPVHILLESARPERSPFPSDRFTVPDPEQLTGVRVALPRPADCGVSVSECNDVTFLNRLDGFHTIPRISLPFDGNIDVSTVTSRNVFLLSLGSTTGDSGSTDWVPRVIGIDQVVWDPPTHTLHFTPSEILQEHSRYAVVLTTGVLDANGRPVRWRYRNGRGMEHFGDGPTRYGEAIRSAYTEAARVTGRHRELAIVSVFTTRSATYLVTKILQRVKSSGTPTSADFHVGPDATRAVIPLSTVRAMTFNRQTTAEAELSPVPVDMSGFGLAPGAVGVIAFGRFSSPGFMAHPGEYIPEIATRSGMPVVQSVNTIYFNLTLPGGSMPAGGWPVAIHGHGSERDKLQVFGLASMLAARGIATIAFSMVGHGFGPNSTITVSRTDGTTTTVDSGGRGIDQNGDGRIDAREGDAAATPRLLQVNADAQVQNIADLSQLVRVLQAGVDVDGDGAVDLNRDRIYYSGHSLGGMYGIGFFAHTPEVRAAVFAVPGGPLLENRRLSPTQRHQFGQMLAARTPSLLNSTDGLNIIGGVTVQPPYFNENLPLRNQPPVVNTVPGAIAIQQFLNRSTWIAGRGDPVSFAPHLRRSPPSGVAPRPFLLLFARSDTASPNPNTSNIIRAGRIEDRSAIFRHDLYWADNPTVPKNPHPFLLQLNVPAYVPMVRDAQSYVAEFFASDGTSSVPPFGKYWRMPVELPLPEDLGYIP